MFYKILFRLKVLLFLIIVFISRVDAGDGDIDTELPYGLNLYIFYTYGETEFEIMKNSFNAASNLLFKATNGQIYIAKINVQNPDFGADFLISNNSEDAFKFPPNTKGLGEVDHFIQLSVLDHSLVNGKVGIVHELGHYLFDLREEYGSASTYCNRATGGIACLMDAGTTLNTSRCQFCTASSLELLTAHTDNNEQHDCHRKSCWEHMELMAPIYYPGVTLRSPSVIDPLICESPKKPPAMIWKKLGDWHSTEFVLNRTMRMETKKLEDAKRAANLYVDLIQSNRKGFIGISSYADCTAVEYQFREISGSAMLRSLKTAINKITAVKTDSSAFGDGLRLAFNQIQAGGKQPRDSLSIETIILLTDGINDAGKEKPIHVLPELVKRGIKVFTIGLGNPNAVSFPVVEDSLQKIAKQTGGLYRNAENTENLSTYLTEYAAIMRGDEVLFEEVDSLSTITTNSIKEKEIFIDSFTKEATFITHWPLGKDHFTLKLIKPNNSTIDSSTVSMDSTAIYNDHDYYKYYRISKPASGLWKMVISTEKDASSSLPDNLRFTTQVLSTSPSVIFRSYTEKYKYNFPQIPTIKVIVRANNSVARADVSGIVRDPDGNIYDIKLYDDGQYSHGDERVDDGSYANRFFNFSKNGSYKIHLTVDNKNGVKAKPYGVADSNWVQQPIAPFKRVSKKHITISGINPDSLLQPIIINVSKGSLAVNTSTSLSIFGSQFVTGANVLFSNPDIFTRNITYVNNTRLTVDVEIPASATVGSSDITVINPGGKQKTLIDKIKIVP